MVWGRVQCDPDKFIFVVSFNNKKTLKMQSDLFY